MTNRVRQAPQTGHTFFTVPAHLRSPPSIARLSSLPRSSSHTINDCSLLSEALCKEKGLRVIAIVVVRLLRILGQPSGQHGSIAIRIRWSEIVPPPGGTICSSSRRWHSSRIMQVELRETTRLKMRLLLGYKRFNFHVHPL